MKTRSPLRGFVSGVMVGLLLGSGGMAVASFGYKGWTRFNTDFKGGYVTGFLDFTNLARNLDPGGYVDQRYPYLPQVKPLEWVTKIDELYAKPENQDYTMASMLQLAAHKLEEKYGKAEDPVARTRRRMQDQLAALAKRRAAQHAQQAPDGQAAPGVAAPTGAAAPAATPPAKTLVPKTPNIPHPRKWCRCDGTDVKAAIAARKAKAEAEERADEEEDAVPEPAPAAAPPASPSAPAASGGK